MATGVQVCGYCGEALSGRMDKKYCSDQCRARAGNKKKHEDEGERFIRQTNQALRQNRIILRRASPEGKTTLRRDVLLQAGFNFRHFTHLYRTKQGSTYYFCYDYGYLLLEDEKVLIVTWQPYMS